MRTYVIPLESCQIALSEREWRSRVEVLCKLIRIEAELVESELLGRNDEDFIRTLLDLLESHVVELRRHASAQKGERFE